MNLRLAVVDAIFQARHLRFLQGRALEVLHSEVRELFSVEELREVGKDEVNIWSRMSNLAGGSEYQGLLEKMEESLVLVHSLFSNLEESPLLPKVCDEIEII